MKFRILAIALLSGVCFAQQPAPNPSTESPTFTINASVLGGGQNLGAATDIGASFAVTKNWYLRSDNIIAPSVNTQGFFGGVQYNLPQLANLLKNTNLNATHFQFYATAALGAARTQIGATGNPVNHFAALAGGGVNYDPTGSGKFSLNLGEVRWAKMPGWSNSTVIVSSGLQLGW
jgi:hypothetical protein